MPTSPRSENSASEQMRGREDRVYQAGAITVILLVLISLWVF